MKPDLVLEKTIRLNLPANVLSHRKLRRTTRREWLRLRPAPILMASAVFALTSTLGRSEPLDPASFPSLGPSPFVSGTYNVDTSFANTAPTIEQGTSVIATGIFYDPTPADTANRDEIAVFTFNSIDLPTGVTLTGLRNANSRPVALLAKDEITISGVIDFSGQPGQNGIDLDGGAGGAAGPGGGGGGGGGAGVDIGGETGADGTAGSGGIGFVSGHAAFGTGLGGSGGSVEPRGGGSDSGNGGGGGAFGGNGGDGWTSHPSGGQAYGDLAGRLEGGSGGAGTGGGSHSGSGGGGGGGAVELGSVTSLVLTGQLIAPGGAAGGSNAAGGAGGGVILHADSVVIDSDGRIDASGGAGNRNGGGGGGGRVLLVANRITTTDLTSTVKVAGGSSGGHPGSDGVLTTTGTVNGVPQISCPQSTSIPCASAAGVSLELSVYVSDPDPDQTLTITLKEGSSVLSTKSASTPVNNLLVGFGSVAFSAASHVLTVEVSDGFVTSSCATSVTVEADTKSPNPDLASLPTITGQCSASVTSVPTATDACAGKINGTTTDPLSYNTQGTFTVHWTYDDRQGNPTVQTQTVVVKDTLAPVPDLASLPTITGQCSASVTSVPTATDACAGKINGTTTDPLSYSTQGTFTIHWTFGDSHGNSTAQTQTVIVQDSLAPVPDLASLPTIIGQCSASVSTVPSAADACAGKINGTTTDPRSYSSQGTFTIHWTYDDSHGNSTVQTQTVIVQDTLAPTITDCPHNQSANATSPTGAVVEYRAATASDNCAPPALSYSSPSESLFAIGDTTVTVTATDAVGNQSTCTFNVHVKGAAEQLSDLIAYVTALPIDDGTRVSLRAKLSAAQSALASGNPQGALTALQDFINATSAMKGKKLTAAQTNRLISDATRIRVVIGG